jgi:diguanylate cyclase (GGDEF)-like protein
MTDLCSIPSGPTSDLHLVDAEEVFALLREHVAPSETNTHFPQSQEPSTSALANEPVRDFSASFWHDVLDRAAAITILIDEQGVIGFESAQWSRVTGRAKNSSIGCDLLDLVSTGNKAGVRDALSRMAAGKLHRMSFDFSIECALLPRSSTAGNPPVEPPSVRTFSATAVNALHLETIGAVVLTAFDITERKALEQTLRHNANHDPLTGLFNRRAAMRTLGQWIADSPIAKVQPAVMLIDLDGFKSVNDAYGHAAGDALLVEIATRLRAIDPRTLGVARFGGDELVVYARFVDVDLDAPRIAQRVLDEVRKPVMAEGQWIYSSACVGIAAYPQGGASADELIRHADIALHQAKAAGRGAIRWFSPREATQQREQLALRTELTNALPNGQFRLHFQPIVAVNTGLVHSHEALLRWQHSERGLLGAASFIAAVEASGLTDAVTQWVIHESFAQARSNIVIASRPIAVNISPRSLRRGDFAQRLITSLTAAAIEPNRIELEITEEDFVRAVDEAPNNIIALHAVGVRIIIDDFGKGFSNFGYLTRFPVYAIKIDREYVSQIGQSERAETLIGALVRLAEELGIKAIGEGVETQEQSDYLLHQGCVLQQGYLHGRPRPAVFGVD